MRRPRRRSSNAWVLDGPAPNISVWMRSRATPNDARPAIRSFMKPRRPANVEIAITWQSGSLKHARSQSPGSSEINIGPILRIGRAVANLAVMASERFEQLVRLLGKRVFAAVTSPV